MSRLTIDMTDQQHQSLKALAALQGKTIKQYALERLFPRISQLHAAASTQGARAAKGSGTRRKPVRRNGADPG